MAYVVLAADLIICLTKLGYLLVNEALRADKDFRIKNIMTMYGDDEKAAKKNLERADKNRADYYELISSQKWGDPRNYDLCIDASLGKEKVAEVICDLAKSAK